MSPKGRIRRVVDFTKYANRHIALWVAYFGWDYNGLVMQKEITGKTIESCLYDALEMTKLVADKTQCNLKKCGRTDRTVSAFQQVFSLHVRSSVCEGLGVFIPEGHDLRHRPPESQQSEYDFPKMLNGCLPRDIKVLAWAPVPPKENFNAQHSTTKRSYKYVFPKGTLDIEAMNSACQFLIGEHDFRNFCKIDSNEKRLLRTIYVKNIYEAFIAPIATTDCSSDDHHYSMYELTVTGSGFLYHQIRFFVSILLLVGEHKEEPTIVSDLLDIEKYPRKPLYTYATGCPLWLNQVFYDDTPELKWQWEKETLHETLLSLQRQWSELQAKATVAQRMLGNIETMLGESGDGFLRQIYAGEYMRKHTPLSKRETEKSLEEKRDTLNLKRKAQEEEEKSESESESCY